MFPALLLVPALLCQAPAPKPSPERLVAQVLDDWHLAAAQADETRYFGHLAQDAIFLGTDATERWDKKAFQAFAHPYFAKGKAWSFKAVRRGIAFAAEGRIAWFDEDLDTPNMGPCRGSGVLELRQGTWKILQYNLTVPIPNPLMGTIKKQIAEFLAQAHAKK